MHENIKYGRKRSGIVKELNAKLTAWANTITDEAVQKAVKKDTIVTGGAIASMLLGERVNDFDVYFKTKETTLMVAQYYVDQFIKNRSDRDDVCDTTPVVVEHAVTNIKGEREERVMIRIASAGVAGEEDEDYHYFELDTSIQKQDTFVDSLDAAVEKKNTELGTYRPVFLSQNAITLTDKVQIVIRFFGNPTELHRNYDFVHAMNYYDWHDGNLSLHPEALEALLSRTLVYRGSLYPIASIFRAKKFVERGWRVSAGQLLKIMWQISELDLTDFNVVKEQLTGVDQAYLWQLQSALANVDLSAVDSTYIGEIIDRIFNQ